MPENQRMVELGKDLLRSSSPNPCSSKASLGTYVVVWGMVVGCGIVCGGVGFFLRSNAGPFMRKHSILECRIC